MCLPFEEKIGFQKTLQWFFKYTKTTAFYFSFQPFWKLNLPKPEKRRLVGLGGNIILTNMKI